MVAAPMHVWSEARVARASCWECRPAGASSDPTITTYAGDRQSSVCWHTLSAMNAARRSAPAFKEWTQFRRSDELKCTETSPREPLGPRDQWCRPDRDTTGLPAFVRDARSGALRSYLSANASRRTTRPLVVSSEHRPERGEALESAVVVELVSAETMAFTGIRLAPR